MSNIYKSSKKGRQVDSAIDYIEKLPQKLTDIELSIKETNNNKADKVSIPKNLSDLIDDITQQNYDANSSSPQSGKAVAEAIAKLLGSAPENLDTLEELAKALNEDENFSATVLAELAAKADAKTVKGGFNGGDGAVAAAGGAIGGNAQAGFGGAVGRNTYTDVGGAIGLNAKAGAGGAIGWNAKAGIGFSGGSNAIAGKDSEDNYIDAIQLGMGTNNKPKTLQIYNHTLLNEDGTIPEERLPILADLATIEYVNSKIGSGGGESNSILGFDYYYEFDDYEKYSDVLDKEFYSPGIYKINIYETDMLDRKFYLSTHILFVSSDSDHYVYSQLEIASIGENPLIRARWGSLNESSTRIIWVDWEDYGISADYVENTAKQTLTDSKTYTDEKIGDIETALDTIIAMQNELTGGGEV